MFPEVLGEQVGALHREAWEAAAHRHRASRAVSEASERVEEGRSREVWAGAPEPREQKARRAPKEGLVGLREVSGAAVRRRLAAVPKVWEEPEAVLGARRQREKANWPKSPQLELCWAAWRW